MNLRSRRMDDDKKIGGTKKLGANGRTRRNAHGVYHQEDHIAPVGIELVAPGGEYSTTGALRLRGESLLRM